MKSKVISGAIALIYLIIAYYIEGFELLLKAFIFLLLPLACIWFSEEMGSYTGIGFGRGAITSTTPGYFVAFGGWLLLLLPLIGGVVAVLLGENPL